MYYKKHDLILTYMVVLRSVWDLLVSLQLSIKSVTLDTLPTVI